eukprot:Hpha_TRINITY_DN16056_c2_g4::TRINITY_DN16056_c2_g4_i1::g.121307::m.121307
MPGFFSPFVHFGKCICVLCGRQPPSVSKATMNETQQPSSLPLREGLQLWEVYNSGNNNKHNTTQQQTQQQQHNKQHNNFLRPRVISAFTGHPVGHLSRAL